MKLAKLAPVCNFSSSSTYTEDPARRLELGCAVHPALTDYSKLLVAQAPSWPTSLAREPLVGSLLLVAMPFAPSSVLVTTSKALVTRSDALVPSSVLAPSSFVTWDCTFEDSSVAHRPTSFPDAGESLREGALPA